ncbi:TetR family transcriptional regulator [Sphingopyxis sp. Root1497]|uniref:TetR/AcrR family transcriptional regulator n=1 Tax=Sphingopyxis sp. Root1497 TaxID=1736474 RepID=UPI0006FBCB5B|nr:TetR/AcrR family transcriptional regulator [Sphingopyxis sp. Root1497]KQZ65733.1 TetR family transcriptional regulator [Sphingopyxis sp. Root1497]
MDQPRSATEADGGAARDKTPRTERGRRTLRKLLDAAAIEFGERGFHEASISGITRRAGTALGSFYTYFDSKDEIFQALVRYMSEQLRDYVTPIVQAAPDGIAAERIGLESFLRFVRDHKEIYRIIDEAEFVDYASYRRHYETTVARVQQRLEAGAARGEIRADVGEIHAWAIGGMNVFLGMRYGLWDEGVDIEEIARVANDLLANGLAKKD